MCHLFNQLNSNIVVKMIRSFENFLAVHKIQLISSDIPEYLWETLYNKLNNEIFDAGTYFSMAYDENNDLHVICNDNINETNYNIKNSIFLIDHAWTFTHKNARKDLITIPSLLIRMENLLGVDQKDINEMKLFERIDFILKNIWKYANSYRLNHLKPEDNDVIWYVMDEFGNAIEHNNKPNFQLVPFYYHDTQISYSLLWQLPPNNLDLKERQDLIHPGDFITIDYTIGISDNNKKIAFLAGLYPNQLIYTEELKRIINEKPPIDSLNELHLAMNRDKEEISDVSTKSNKELQNYPLKIYSDLALLHEFLTDTKYFIFVNDEKEADVFWPTWHIKNFKDMSKYKYINQFPNEKILTCKDLLYQACLSSNKGKRPKWLAETYNMETELPELIDNMIHKNNNNEIWICKPWNMARSLDITIGSTSSQLSKLSLTGPKITSRYIINPVLYNNKKFDIRYIVLLKSIDPLELYVINLFWLRFANKEFSLDSFDDYEKHFTVMNYSDHALTQIGFEEFIPEFEKQYPSHNWKSIQVLIYSSIKELFVLTCNKSIPGLHSNFNSRAIYGIDVMLEWENDKTSIQPIILETNFQPDCVRACKYHRDFFNDVMKTLLLGKAQDSVYGVTKL